MAIRVVTVDDNFDPPEVILNRTAQRLQDVNTSEGRSVAKVSSEQVVKAIDSEDLIKASDHRLPKVDNPEAFYVKNFDGGIPFRVEGDSTYVGNTEMRPTDSEHFTLESSSGHLLFDVDPVSGKVYAPNLHVDSIDIANSPSNSAISRIILNVQLGQSNGEGRGRPFGPSLDPVDPRIQMYDWPTGSLKTATVPLSSQQQQTGLSVITEISRETLRKEPTGTQVVILNAAVGGSPLVAVSESTGTWNPSYTGSAPKLTNLAMTALDKTILAIKTQYEITPEVRIFWHQGEADTSTVSEYSTVLDLLITTFRAKYGSSVSFIIGGMVPEYLLANPNRKGVRVSHLEAPLRNTLTAYADGIPNGGGSANTADLVHYARIGVEKLGESMYQAYRRSLANTSSSTPTPPQSVFSVRRGNTTDISWTNPFCRVTGYKVEHSVDGEIWSIVSPTESPMETSISVEESLLYIRVSTINENGTSAPSTPIYTLGA